MDMLTEHHRLARVRSMHKELAIIVLGLWPLVMHAMQNPPDHRDIDFYELAPSSLGYGLHRAFTESGFKSMPEGEITHASSLPTVYRSVKRSPTYLVGGDACAAWWRDMVHA